MDFKFDDKDDEDLLSKNMVTIAVQKRNGKKCITKQNIFLSIFYCNMLQYL